VSAVTDALDRMDFWSRVIVLELYSSRPERVLSNQFHRILTAVAVSQFQAAQEAAREAQI
jgi:hypothetical protein